MTAIMAAELRRVFRDRTGLFFIVVLPIVIIVLVGGSIGAGSDRLPVGVIDADRTAVSLRLVDALRDEDALELIEYTDEDELRTDIRLQTLAGGVVIEAGFADRIDGGESAPVRLLADQNQGATLTVANVVANAIDHVSRTVAAGRFAAVQTGADAGRALALAEQLDTTLPPLTVDVDTIGSASAASVNDYSYTAPSNLVLFVFINSLTAGAQIAESRRLGITRRALSAPINALAVVGGFALTRMLLSLFQSALILVVGSVMFGVDWGDPLAATLLVLVFAALSTGAGLLIGTIADTPEQVQSIGIPLSLGMAMLGGCMWPLEVVPEGVRQAAHFTPHAWAMDGWIELIFEGGGLGSITTELAVLSALAVVVLGLATLRLERSVGT